MRQVLKGVWIMLLAVLLLAVMDAIGKKQSETLPTFQVLISRTLIIVGASWLWIYAEGVEFKSLTKLPQLGLQLLRGLAWALTALFFYVAFAGESLTLVYLVTFLHPAFCYLLVWAIRGERPIAKMLWPLCVMFGGVILATMQKSSGSSISILILAGLAALFFALEAVLTKEIKRVSSELTNSVTLFISASVGLSIFLVGLGLHYVINEISFGQYNEVNEIGITLGYNLKVPVWVEISKNNLGLLLIQGFCAFFANLAFIQAYEYASERILAPLDYAILIFAAAIEFFIFGVLPTEGVWLGAPLIVAGGVWLAWTESRSSADQDNPNRDNSNDNPQE